MDIHLFDMDSVLLMPGGYRAALVETINYFSRQLGLGDLGPTHAEMEAIESYGITSEWDSAPIAIVEIMQTGQRPDYIALTERVSAEWRKGEYAAEAAWRLFSNSPTLRIGELENYLLYSRDISRSAILNVFQQFTLGDQFEATYQLPKTIDTHSTLLKHDRPLLARAVPPHSVIYTARPCKAPRDVAPRLGFAPEAELGAELVGLSHLPLIGFGSFQWLAEELGNGVVSEHFLKPLPTHGLAAIAAALGGPESEAVRAGEAAKRGEWLSPLKELRAESGRVIVFEDTARSIGGVREAVSLLGGNWTCVGIGIAAGGPKREALSKVADRLYNSLNDALDSEISYTL
jgi:hypothetical protein